jgi:hypothetical protein
MLRWDGEGSSVAPPLESRSPLPAIFSDTDRGADDVLMLVEQLDMATSTLCKESQEVEWLRLSVAGAKREMVAAELATTKDEARLTGKAFDMI